MLPMRNPRDHTKRQRAAVQRSARRGTMYDRIAEAREKREQRLADLENNPDAINNSATIAALRGQAAPEPVERQKEDLGTVFVEADETHIAEPDDDWTYVEEDEPRQGNGVLWVASLTIAAIAVGSVLWLSRPASTSADDIAPILADRTVAPAADIDIVDGLVAPSADEPLAQTAEPSDWEAPARVALTRTAAPSLDALPNESVAEAPEVATPWPKPRPERAFEVADVEAETIPTLPVPVARDIRVVLNAPRTVPDESLAAVIDALQQSGANPDPRRVNLTISTSNVRYFHSEDAEAAAVIANGIGARLRDFTDFQPAPPEGLVEIWLAGSEIASASRTRDGERPLDQFAQDLRQLQRDLRRALGGN